MSASTSEHPLISPTATDPNSQAGTEENDMCMVAPSPELQARLKERYEEIRAQLGAPPSGPEGSRRATKAKATSDAKDDLDAMVNMLMRFKQPSHIGFNDGLIVPGEHYPLGTPPRTIRRAAADRAPLTGTVRVIVVLVNFKDKAFTAAHNKAHFEKLFFSTGVLPKGSVKEYFKEVTDNKVIIEGQVAGPFTLSQNMSYYANGESGTGSVLPNARTMAQEAAQLANPSVNFAPFDNDGNGFVDAFIVIHAGSGAEQTGSVNDIWSHKWVLPSQFNADGTKIYAYLTVPEDSRIGVCCHELGHLLFGFPDLYDTDGSSEGVGNWCLMGGGSWLGGGDVPAHPSAWCKANQGWVTVASQAANGNVTILDVKTSKKVYRLWKDGTGGNEYFLVENRQRTLYDAHLPGDGLLIWHIDESIGGNSSEVHPKVKLMEADGADHLAKGINRGDAGDTFPGSGNKTSFTNSTTPNSKSYGGVNTCVGVTNISPSSATMTARFNVRCFVKPHKETAKELEKGVIKESKKEINKELQKEIKEKEFKEKEFKEVKEFKEFKEAKEFEKPGEGLGGFGAPAGRGQYGAAEPFIGAELRPDLTRGALHAEDDLQELRTQMEIGSAESKRLFDTKLPEV